MKEITVYLHSSKDTMFEKGEKLGLTGEALSNFSYALSEVAVELEVNEVTGDAKVLSVTSDGRTLI